ncbi:MAG: HEAT repeat domain-containing protein [Pyrinomonadaceae bacterium]
MTILENDAALRNLYLNINQKCIGRMSGEMWTLTHAYESKSEVDKVLDYFIGFFKAIESDDAKQVAKLNGAQGFKETFSKFLDSKDEAVQAFSLFMLGCAGDRAYASKIAKIVNERDPSFTDRFSGNPTFVRGRAALALGALQATEYKPDIAKLLKSQNYADRSGAISVLAEMKALEFTNEIVAIMTNNEFAFDDDDSPIYFLIETKQAEKFKKEIVRAMLGESREKVPESAAYALAALGSREHANDIALLLKNEFRQADAAKALALMGATEYADEIAKLLAAKSGLTKRASLISLAILDSRKYVPKMIQLYKDDPEGYVKSEAATALLLMGFSQYYRESSGERSEPSDAPKLLEMDFHYFVRERLNSLNEKLSTNLRSVKPT